MTSNSAPVAQPKGLDVIPIPLPPTEQRVGRGASFASDGERRNRYHLPSELRSASPVGYRTRVPLSQAEAAEALSLLSLERPTGFAAAAPVTEGEMFEECALGILSSRQSTNYRGFRQVTFGPEDSTKIATLMRSLDDVAVDVLDGAAYTHVVLARPYRTPFTFLLTFVGHLPLINWLTVLKRALLKRFQHIDDIPTIGFLKFLHLGILADAMERAPVIASRGRRRAQIHFAPFLGEARRKNRARVRELAKLCGLTAAERAAGWHVALVAQVGESLPQERLELDTTVCRKVGANLLAFRSQRIQPGVNQAESAPAPYQTRQDMDVPDALTMQAGRAAYNAFAHWADCDRERAKELLLLDRIDVLTDGGKERLRDVRRNLEEVTELVARRLPLWADLALMRLLSKNVRRGKKAFALAGQRIYVGGLSRREVEAAGLGWEQAITATGAASARSALLVELMGVVDLPSGCDLLAGVCMMAGPVNQNDIGKQFYGHPDLLARTYAERDPTSLLVWTLKAKTVEDPVGNEEQLLNPARKGALVDLRPGPHEVVHLRRAGKLSALRDRHGSHNQERAFGDVGNYITDPNGEHIPGNVGEPWPEDLRAERLW